MKRKIVISVPMHHQKDKSKAMKIVVDQPGVISVNLGGENDRLEIIGEGVDSVRLANSLRKKFPYADIVSVGEMTQTESPDSSPPTSPKWSPPQYPPYMYPPPPCQPFYYESRYYDPGPPNCSIL